MCSRLMALRIDYSNYRIPVLANIPTRPGFPTHRGTHVKLTIVAAQTLPCAKRPQAAALSSFSEGCLQPIVDTFALPKYPVLRIASSVLCTSFVLG